MIDKHGVEIPDNKERGLYGKYIIYRADGQEIPDEEFMFVLKGTDKHAIPALEAYVESCEEEYPLLAEDLRGIIEHYQPKINPAHIGSSFDDWMRENFTEEEIADIEARAIEGVMMSFDQYEMQATRNIFERAGYPQTEFERGRYRMFFGDENDVRETPVVRCWYCFAKIEGKPVVGPDYFPYKTGEAVPGDNYCCHSHMELDQKRLENEQAAG